MLFCCFLSCFMHFNKLKSHFSNKKNLFLYMLKKKLKSKWHNNTQEEYIKIIVFFLSSRTSNILKYNWFFWIISYHWNIHKQKKKLFYLKSHINNFALLKVCLGVWSNHIFEKFWNFFFFNFFLWYFWIVLTC
jgi:hypothetical protein